MIQDARLRRYAEYCEALTPPSLEALDALMTPDVVFSDPFNDVQGLEATRRIFEHMFRELEDARFTIAGAATTDDQQAGLLRWTFTAVSRGRPLRIEGMSQVRFAPDGRVCSHIDYWDAGRLIYEGVPLLGGLLRLIRRRLEA